MANLDELKNQVANLSASHRAWVLPILRALEELGGSATPKLVRGGVAAILEGRLTDAQIAQVLKNRLHFSRFEMKRIGLVAGEWGTWAITELGREYLMALRDQPLDLHGGLSEVSAGDESPGLPKETVTATHHDAYGVPLLKVMADGVREKGELMERLFAAVRPNLLPGDLRLITDQREPVWRYRAAWALSFLQKNGDAKNVARGVWEITQAGRARLAQDEPSWKIMEYQSSKARVFLEEPVGGTEEVKPAATPPASGLSRWSALEDKVGTTIFTALQQRLRPDMGPTPEREQDFIPRNVILYGPPGTGKTFVASAVAQALAGDADPEAESRWRIVQFHPSYAYEDFIQGLKPDLQQKELRYELRPGPFLQLCDEATNDPDRFYVLIIDEINRGDPARIFGELLYALEYRGCAVDLPLGGQLTVPPNLVVLGTMNSVDRSVALVDYALRRRFGFVRVGPDPEVILTVRGEQPGAELAAAVLESFNEWLTSRLDREHTLGHSFFLNPAVPLDGPGALDKIWQMDVFPLLEEYFFGEPEALEEASRRWTEALAKAASEADEPVQAQQGAPASSSTELGNG